MRYCLMNKNNEMVSFITQEKYGVTEVVDERKISDRMPPGYLDIRTWIENRNYAKHKEHMRQWLKEWGIDNIDGFLNITHALGVNDSLWVKPEGSVLTWEQVNLYTNDFSDISCRTAFETGLFGLQLSTTTPEFTTDGTFPKCWLKDEQGIHILKQGLSGAANVGLEPYCEYISSNIGKQIYDNVVSYDLVQYKGKLCSKCGLFTAENMGYVPFGRLIDNNVYYTIPRLIEYFREYDRKHGKKFEQEFRKMIFIDSIVFNHDRHLCNFGFLFDNNTFEIVGFAPLFDFNFSFLCSLTMDDLKDYRESMIKYDIGHKIGGAFDAVGKDILTPDMKDMLLPPSDIIFPKHEKYNMDEERTHVLEDIFYSNYENIVLRKY